MARISQRRLQEFFRIAEDAETTTEKGRALEDMTCYLFDKVPGITITKRNELNVFQSEEIDVAFWNKAQPNGFYFLPNIILVECKNWSSPLGSEEVSWFDSKLRRRAQPFGILIATNGITGDPNELTSAHDIISTALTENRQLVVITKEEVLGLNDTEELVELIQEKLCELAVAGTLLL